MVQLERRRFRTWEPDAEAHTQRAWRIIWKYGMARVIRTWYGVLLLVLALIGWVIALGSYSYALVEVPNGLEWEMVIAFISSGVTACVLFLLVFGAPLFAEDLRFNAPLFYFSKPVRTRDYVLGKSSILATLLLAVAVVPVVLFLIVSLFGVLTAQPVGWDGRPLTGPQLTHWQATQVHTLEGWLFVVATVLPGFLVYLAFLSSLFIVLSAYTSRAWHAAIGAVALFGGWSILGLTASSVNHTAIGEVFGPMGWFHLIIVAPLEWRFGRWNVRGSEGSLHLENLGVAIMIAYLLIVAATVAAWALALRKIRQMEGIA